MFSGLHVEEGIVVAVFEFLKSEYLKDNFLKNVFGVELVITVNLLFLLVSSSLLPLRLSLSSRFLSLQNLYVFAVLLQRRHEIKVRKSSSAKNPCSQIEINRSQPTCRGRKLKYP